MIFVQHEPSLLHTFHRPESGGEPTQPPLALQSSKEEKVNAFSHRNSRFDSACKPSPCVIGRAWLAMRAHLRLLRVQWQ